MKAPVITTRDLTVGYKLRGSEKVVSKSLSLDLFVGELVCLLGPNGAGKSTLMRTLAGLQPELAGDIFIANQNLKQLHPTELAKKLSLVLTERVEAGNLTVKEVVTLGRTPYTGWLGSLSETDHEAVRWAMDATETTIYEHQRIHLLSDGERQKVMLARALAQDTNVILLDEPTAHLDLPSRVEMMRLLHQLARKMKKTILLSTHELDLALQAADKLWLMTQSGNLMTGTPEDLVLNGGFEAAFAKPGFHFDTASGTFTIHEEPVLFQVHLSGNPQLIFWTRRALRREGIGVIDEENALQKVFAAEEGKWILDSDGVISEYFKLEKLIEVLSFHFAQRRKD